MTNVCVVCRGEIYTCEVAGAGKALGWDGDPQDYVGERVPEHWHHRGAGGHPARPAWKAQRDYMDFSGSGGYW